MDRETFTQKPIKNLDKFAHDLFGNRYVYYRRKGNYAECHCAECGEKYILRMKSTGDPFEDDCIDIELPARDKETKCRKCGIKAIYKPAGHTKSEYHFNHIMTGQKISDNKFAFVSWYSWQKTYAGCKTRYEMDPEHLIICEKGKGPLHYYNSSLYGWLRGGGGINFSYTMHPQLLKEIKKTGMYKYIPIPCDVGRYYNRDSWITDFYSAAAHYPDFEMLVKLGLDDYWRRLMDKAPVYINPRGKTIQDRLRIRKDRLKDFIEARGDHNMLFLYQLERKLGAQWTDEDLEIVTTLRERCYDKKYQGILQYASPIRIRNYMRKQKMWPRKGDNYRQSSDKSQMRREYFDYIEMRKQAGYEMNDIQLFPNDFKRRHDEMVLETEKKKAEERKNQVNKKYGKIKEKYHTLSDKYSAAAGGLIIRPPKDAAEIVAEGRLSHHCVGGDSYLRSHNNGNSFILFLRKIDNKETPYITVEIRGNEIVQWYGAYDKKPDKNLIDAWLKTYCKELTKREKTPKKTKCTGTTKTRRTA